MHEGSLFPLKQGLLFMKPGVFLPREDIEEVRSGVRARAFRAVFRMVGVFLKGGM